MTSRSKYYRCAEFNRVQIRLDGRTSLCCLLPNAIFPIEEVASEKKKLNHAISSGDFSLCGACPNIYETHSPGDKQVRTIDIFTNTGCPGRCFYCAYTQPGGLTEQAINMDQPAVKQHVTAQGDLRQLIEKYLESPGGKSLCSVSLSGGDSSLHPEFVPLVEDLIERNIRVCYLSFGLISRSTEQFIIEKIKSGMLDLSISIDAVNPATWAKIKGRPESEFGKITELIKKAAESNGGRGLYVKFIISKYNFKEVGRFVEYWYNFGVRKFSISAMHHSTAEATANACSDEEYELACKAVVLQFQQIAVSKGTMIVLDAFNGLERFLPYHPMIRFGESPVQRICQTIIRLMGESNIRKGRRFLTRMGIWKHMERFCRMWE